VSIRSFRRAQARRVARERRRLTLVRHRALATGAALGASAAFASAAQANSLVVQTNGDDPAGTFCTGTPPNLTCATLRDAITQSNSDSSPDTITFANTVTSPITLTNGALTINGGQGVTIDGPGAGKLAVSGAGTTRVFSIALPKPVSISGLTITRGSAGTADGGAIYDNAGGGPLTLSDDTVSDSTNTATGDSGGGIWSNAPTTIAGSTITGNTAPDGDGGGVAALYQTDYIINSTISDNSALTGGGIVSGAPTAELTLTGSHVTGNDATSVSGAGGGIAASGGTLVIDGTTVSNNHSADRSGGILVGTKYGATISRATISGNSSLAGGGLELSGNSRKYNPVQIAASTISGNQAARGAGVVIDRSDAGNPIEIGTSTISANHGGNSSFGGGVLIEGRVGSPINVIDSTISGNTATDGAGVSLGYGGSKESLLYATNTTSGSIDFRNSTVARNSASADGGGLYLAGYNNGHPNAEQSGVAGITSTIVAGNTAAGKPQDLARAAGSTSGGFKGAFSLIQKPDGAPILSSQAMIFGLDPKLGPLKQNGGPTLTMKPAGNSPVIDQGHAPSSLKIDQRGDPRTVDVPGMPEPPGGDGTDIGSVELPARSVIVPIEFTASIHGKPIGGSSTPLLVAGSTPVTCTAKLGKLSSCVVEVRSSSGKLLADGESTSSTPVPRLSTNVTPTAAGIALLSKHPLGVNASARVTASTTASGSQTINGKVHFLPGPSITLPIANRSDKLSQSTLSLLDQVAKLLASAKSITCTAYSDKGKNDLALTKAQAKAACDRLVKDGFKGKVTSVGKGHADLIAPPSSPRNRRLVITFSF